MRAKVVIVGSGELGSRYLQGLVSVPIALNIVAVDLRSVSLETAATRWAEAGGRESKHEFSTCNDITLLADSADLAIIATSSTERLHVVRTLASQCNVRHWILEKLITNDADQLTGLERLFVNQDTVWVNLPRRTMVWHHAIQQRLDGTGPFSVTINGQGYGLLTTAIHYIHLVGWWAKATVTEVGLELGPSGFFESKRSGYVESEGVIRVSYSDGTYATITCKVTNGRDTPIRSPKIEILSRNGLWELDESLGVMTGPNGQLIEGRLELQSEMTADLVSRILIGSECSLPSVSEIVGLHEKLLRAFQRAWQERPIFSNEIVPVT